MANSNWEKTRELTQRLQAINFDGLAISDYNKQYIGTLVPVLQYYMDIYYVCLENALQSSNLHPSKITMVDYGGGSGFLSMLAKEYGIGKVIYIDLNPLSVNTIKLLKEETGIGPDVILEGNSDTLAEWCKTNHVKPELLIATDLIEHVYDLNVFFKDLVGINEDMHMLFTTASNPYNPFVLRRLSKLMKTCESGKLGIPNYYTLRLNFIKEQYPELSVEQAKLWAKQTRGLIYQDIKKAVDSNILPTLADRYNTCDPATGNWVERVLPIKEYIHLGEQHNLELSIGTGFYNCWQQNKWKTFAANCLNLLIEKYEKTGLALAPFIILSFRGK